MKAILEIDAPTSCSKCPLCYVKANMVNECFVLGVELLPVPFFFMRHHQCPLKIKREREWRAECKKCGRKWVNWYAFGYCDCGEKLEGAFYDITK
jgi:hypothetical protein